MERKKENNLKEYEARAEELVSMTLGVCEQQIAVRENQGEALSSAAMCVRDSVKTFLAVTRLPHAEKTEGE
jgi:hypothetical protein